MEFGKSMGGVWLEHNLPAFVHHVLHLVANPRAAPSHVDAVYARKCVLFIMRMLFGGILGETAQMTAAREVCRIIVNEMNILGESSCRCRSPLFLNSELLHTSSEFFYLHLFVVT